ncbi:MAG TPA: hypothetical protein VHI13_22385 [Candidatus Kapabacteria bacterium]|nr:hypothetical protein [Candidatus Kapabacteria bacterium]
MNGRIQNPLKAILATAVVAAALALGTVRASAQIVWNPPCGNVTVFNLTGCTIGLCPAWAPPLVPPCTPFIAPGGNVVVPTPGPALKLNGMVSRAGIVYPLLPLAAPPPPPAGAAVAWVPNFMTGPAPGCCVDVYVDPAGCNMWVFPSTGIPPCRP